MNKLLRLMYNAQNKILNDLQLQMLVLFPFRAFSIGQAWEPECNPISGLGSCCNKPKFVTWEPIRKRNPPVAGLAWPLGDGVINSSRNW